jgi:hypothetical protein
MIPPNSLDSEPKTRLGAGESVGNPVGEIGIVQRRRDLLEIPKGRHRVQHRARRYGSF